MATNLNPIAGYSICAALGVSDKISEIHQTLLLRFPCPQVPQVRHPISQTSHKLDNSSPNPNPMPLSDFGGLQTYETLLFSLVSLVGGRNHMGGHRRF